MVTLNCPLSVGEWPEAVDGNFSEQSKQGTVTDCWQTIWFLDGGSLLNWIPREMLPTLSVDCWIPTDLHCGRSPDCNQGIALFLIILPSDRISDPFLSGYSTDTNQACTFIVVDFLNYSLQNNSAGITSFNVTSSSCRIDNKMHGNLWNQGVNIQSC